MKRESEYFEFTQDVEIRKTASEKADIFINQESQFHLGHLPTEQSHPYTRDFSQTVRGKTTEGIRQLLDVDRDLPPVARRIMLSEEYGELVSAITAASADNRRICFSGCGSTGRLSMLLEEMWRQYWEDLSGAAPGYAARNPEEGGEYALKANLACSIMTGGDRALIKSVENFEDYSEFGMRQVFDLGLGKDDLLIAVTEGGETSSVLGTAEAAIKSGSRVFLVFNNPSSLLRETVDRSRRIIESGKATVIDLFSGPMALSGSTRMQATTLEMMILGSAMEEALASVSGISSGFENRLLQSDRFAVLISSLCREDNLSAMADLAERESRIYSSGGRVTYLADRFLLDIFSDTTERSPTFMLPPFRRFDDSTAPVSWAFAKDYTRPGIEAWFNMLRRSPRGLEWTSSDYRKMSAPQALIDTPPVLGNNEIYRYRIGNEKDTSRDEINPFLFLYIEAGPRKEDYEQGAEVLRLGNQDEATDEKIPGKGYRINISLPESRVNLWHHLALKLVLNTVSTASMGLMGRIQGNWMIQLDPTNKKLIDRGSRIIAQLAGISYEDSCRELYISLLAREKLREYGGETTTSPVVDALERLEVREGSPF